MSTVDETRGAPAVPKPLLEVLARGWALSRGTPPPIAMPDFGWRIEVNRPGQRVRYLSTGHDLAAVRDVACRLIDPGTWLKVLAPHEVVRPLLGALWELQDVEYCMRIKLRPTAPPSLASLYSLNVAGDELVWAATAHTSDGGMVASGRMALVGAHAVFDQVQTVPAHRRTGLGSAIMLVLQAVALERGCSEGVLLASQEGAHLYRQLGWSLQTLTTVAIIR